MNEPAASAPAKTGGKVAVGASAWLASPFFLVAAGMVLAVGFFFLIRYIADTFTHESTDDAFIAGHIVSVAPRVAGQVSAVHVHDNQIVRSNDLLVELDPADFAITVSQKEAAVISQSANFRSVVAGYELMQAKVETAEATARKAKADADAAEATAKLSESDLARAKELQKQNTLSQRELDAAIAANNKAQADWKSARESFLEENSKVAEASRTREAAFAQKDMAIAQLNEANTNVAQAKLNLSYARIFAPCDGYVTRKSVEAGDYLQVGQQVMFIVQPSVWVVANFKESQLENIRTNQPALVKIDSLGGKKFRAHVESLQAGSGAAFSVLPPENATGNFVKVIQRVPVKIVFDEPLPTDKVLGPGLSVEPSVEVSSFAPPQWLVALAAMILAVVSVVIFRFFVGRNAD